METEIEKIQRIMGKKESNNSSGFLMPFGKFAGRDLSDIRTSYLHWTLQQELDQELIEAIESELERRE